LIPDSEEVQAELKPLLRRLAFDDPHTGGRRADPRRKARRAAFRPTGARAVNRATTSRAAFGPLGGTRGEPRYYEPGTRVNRALPRAGRARFTAL